MTTPTTPAKRRAEQERVLELATAAVNEMLRGKLWQHVKTGGVYLEYGRGTTVFPKRAGSTLFSEYDGVSELTVTDDIERGEETVRYFDVVTREGYARPARLFDDGRFIPLTLAPAALLGAYAEALEQVKEMQAAIRNLMNIDARHREFLASPEGFESDDAGFSQFRREFDAAYGRLQVLAPAEAPK